MVLPVQKCLQWVKNSPLQRKSGVWRYKWFYHFHDFLFLFCHRCHFKLTFCDWTTIKKVTFQCLTLFVMPLFSLFNGYAHNQQSPIDLDLDRFVRRDRSSPVKKNTFVGSAQMLFYYHAIHYYVILSQPVPTDWLHMSQAWLIKIYPQSQIFLRCVRADLDLILNGERFAQIWFWVNLSRSDSLNWLDVWFWTYPMCVLFHGSCTLGCSKLVQ